ncbi:MAG: hypothetical protein ORO03_00625 [Alphaproteobacteria bacterium]|nr:hypothetical protein [Alphaproteobacteria bacterium]
MDNKSTTQSSPHSAEDKAAAAAEKHEQWLNEYSKPETGFTGWNVSTSLDGHRRGGIALFRLYDGQTHVPENVIKAHEDAMQRLRAIRDGKETIDLSLASPTDSREGSGAEFFAGSPKLFGLKQTMGGSYGRS